MTLGQTSKTILSIGFFLLSMVWAHAASAHAIILESIPAVNAVTKRDDLPITLRFNSRIDPLRSKLILVKPDQSNQTLNIQSKKDVLDVIASHATNLSPGDYRIRWQVLSIDGHITRGDIPFTVQP